jgi:transcriptional regulator with XRE-family HTH domain
VSEKSQLINKLKNSFSSRVAYTRATTSVNVASQIKALRRRRKMTQKELSKLMGTGQSRISAMERPGELLTVDTLVRLASTFRVGLVVKFVPFSQMLNWENSYSQDSFDATSIEKDTEFLEPKSIETTHLLLALDKSLVRVAWSPCVTSKLEGSHPTPVRAIKAQDFELAGRVFGLENRSSIGQVRATASSTIH